jgi:hypothetical protein
MKLNIIDQRDIEKLTNRFTDLEKKQVPFATKYALNAVVSATVAKTKQEIEQKFDWKRNIPYITKYKFATNANLIGEVFLNKKSWGWYTLHQHFNGGDRSAKGLEIWLKKNRFLGENDFLSLPRNGQTKAGASKSIIAAFKQKKFNRFFIVNNSKSGKNGIYAKATAKKFEGKWDTRAVVMLFKIIRKPTYKQRIDLNSIPTKVWKEKGIEFFKKGMEIGMKNAK